jgi:FkbM family methyltransferase
MFDSPKGGTELMYEELMQRLPQFYKDRYSIFNYISQADFTKKTIYWCQLSYDQEAIQFLKDESNINLIDYFVFVSYWQYEKFRQTFNIPAFKCHILKNASIGISDKMITTNNKLKICYTSTPWRGLDILLKAWEILQPKNCELHVFSSCKIYGKDFAEQDSLYQELYDTCEVLPNVVYRGSIPNEDLRKELLHFDILAYPNTFEETSCIAVIEALSAGLRVVTSSLGALPETTEGFAKIYPFYPNKQIHAQKFAEVLKYEIELMSRGKLNRQLQFQQDYYRNKWSWDSRINDWIDFLDNSVLTEEDFYTKNSWDKDIFKECFISNDYGVTQLDENDVVIDLGAHIGSFSRMCYNYGSRRIYGFEADTINFEFYEKNKREGMTCVNKAVWRSDIDVETLKFDSNIVDANTGMGTFFGEGTIEVQCVKLDDVLEKFNTVRVIKIDVEGSEYPILYTSKKLDKVKEIVGEFHEDRCFEYYNDYAPNREGLKSFLEDNGFEVVQMESSLWSATCGNFKAIKKQ